MSAYQPALFLVAQDGSPGQSALNPALGQWFTPAWAAEAIIEQEFGWLKPGQRVLEPSCGDGAFLCALPAEIDAVGVEIDPLQAARAAANSGRQVLIGDFRSVDADLIGPVDAIIGNPPFEASVVADFVARSARLLPDGGQAGFILPAYIFQTSSKVEMLSSQFSIEQKMLPRNLFPGLKLPLVFAKFIKERHPRLYGFLLYREAQSVRELERPVQESVSGARDPRGAWHKAVVEVLRSLGGEASLGEIYDRMSARRPSENPWWKEKVRQVVQRAPYFVRVSQGRYALA